MLKLNWTKLIWGLIGCYFVAAFLWSFITYIPQIPKSEGVHPCTLTGEDRTRYVKLWGEDELSKEVCEQYKREHAAYEVEALKEASTFRARFWDAVSNTFFPEGLLDAVDRAATPLGILAGVSLVIFFCAVLVKIKVIRSSHITLVIEGIANWARRHRIFMSITGWLFVLFLLEFGFYDLLRYIPIVSEIWFVLYFFGFTASMFFWSIWLFVFLIRVLADLQKKNLCRYSAIISFFVVMLSTMFHISFSRAEFYDHLFGFPVPFIIFPRSPDSGYPEVAITRFHSDVQLIGPAYHTYDHFSILWPQFIIPLAIIFILVYFGLRFLSHNKSAEQEDLR